jgi:hypothetical protein
MYHAMRHPRTVCSSVLTALLLAGVLTLPHAARAYYAGGGKDAAKGNDCLIGYEFVDPDQLTDPGTKKQAFVCKDCDPSCDLDGVNTPNGSCTMAAGACINQGGVTGCTPASGLDKATAKGKVQGVKGAAGKVVIDTSQLLQGSACGAMVDVVMPLKSTKKGLKERKAKIKLSALLKKNKSAGISKRKDKDKLTYICQPRPEGEACPAPPTTTTTTTTIPTALSFVTGAPGGPCGTANEGGPGGTVLKTLTCGGLNIGAGSGSTPEGPTPGGAETQFNISGGPVYTLSGRTSAESGSNNNCSDTGCNFGTWLPITGVLSTCVRNTFSAPATGTLDSTTGDLTAGVPLDSAVYLTNNPTEPCPLCVGGTVGMTDSGTCDAAWRDATGFASPNAGDPCTPTDGTGHSYECGPRAQDLTGNIPVDLTPLTTGTASKSDAGGIFCPAQTVTGAFGLVAVDYIEENGSPAGPLTSAPTAVTLASVFCIPLTGNSGIDVVAGLPGPGATSLPGTLTLLP